MGRAYVGRTVGESLLPLSESVQYLCSALQKNSFTLLNIEVKTW